MFTGIIKATARVLHVFPAAGVQKVTVERPAELADLYPGASIACDGICLTVLRFDGQSFDVEVMRETLQKTTAGSWRAGTLLNLEPALQLGGRLDGHWVLGHVDRRAKLLEKKLLVSTSYLRFSLDSRDRELLVPQGSIAVNGVSLTVAALSPQDFSVALISHTLQNSNLGRLDTGAAVNLEYDILGKYAARMHKDHSLSPGSLYEQGF